MKKDTRLFLHKDVFIFSIYGFFIFLYVVFIFTEMDLSYVRVPVNLISYLLMQYIIIDAAYADVENDIAKYKEEYDSGNLNVVPAVFNNLTNTAYKCKQKWHKIMIIPAVLLSIVQLFVPENVATVIGDFITFIIFILSCDDTFFIKKLYSKMKAVLF